MWTVPAIIAMAQRLMLEELAPHWLPSGLAAWAGAVAGAYFFTREVYPAATLRAWLHEMLAHWGLTFVWLGLFVGIAALMPVGLDLIDHASECASRLIRIKGMCRRTGPNDIPRCKVTASLTFR